MIINEVELQELDIYDLEVAEKYDKAFNKVVNEMQKLGAVAEPDRIGTIKATCEAVFNCFNEIFGEGTDKKVFGDKVNLFICLKAFEDLTANIKEQDKKLVNITNKYTSNRAQRRAKKK